ncbi:hypothetical protein [Ktedonospora formicarum]|uniref:Uncharacterized protein n=1 Tax=Ktedonospora formicarum TaxID=2778364 RepID=A0A8J3HRW3_9CHLR|nr:hypothetical protein [Ktedonospora formicarum]GHO42141.1 hypothetical protein KSX_03040 [Ktedonospora formicarum]
MQRWLFVLVLIVIAPLVAEVLSGSTPITQPGLLLVDLVIYGPGALLIRELVRRRHRGWASILLMGVAYGLVEEGLALQSLFDPTYATVALWGARFFGVNWVYTSVVLTWIHPLWSVAIPIVLAEFLFPAQRALPSLGRFGLVATSVWYILGVVLLAFFARTISSYSVPPLVSGVVIVIALMLVVNALFLLPRQRPRTQRSDQFPKPFGILLFSGMSAFLALGIPALLWRPFPMLTQFPLVLVPLLAPPVIALILIWRFVDWARSSSWNDRHLLALVSGMLIAHSAVGALLFSKTVVERVALAVMGLLMVIFLGWLWVQIRNRKVVLTTTS